MKLFIFCFICAFVANFYVSYGFDVVSFKSGFDNYGIIAGFGDYNQDKLVDVFVISPSGDQLDVILVYEHHSFYRKNLYNLTWDSEDRFVSGIMLADFDGDRIVDILLCLKHVKTSRISLEVLWGNESKSPFRFSGTFVDEPVLFDYNADMLPDLLTENVSGSWTIHIANVKAGFVPMEPLSRSPLAVPHSSAFVDLLEAYAADLFVTTQDGFEVYRNASARPWLNYTYNSTSNPTIYASSFGDFNQDAKMEHIIPVCDEDSCSIQVYDYSTETWSTMLSLEDSDWTFKQLRYNDFRFPPTLNVGDYNLDGFPDVVTVLYSPTLGQRAVLLMNVPCTTDGCASYGRMFNLDQQSMPGFINSTLSAAFFDISEEGKLDIVLTAEVTNASTPELVFLNSDISSDNCFLKATVVSGRSSSQPRYGLNVPGPTVKYETTSSHGGRVRSAGGQLSQSAHFALQLPYIMFGLGLMPNFVSEVGVGIPNELKKQQVDRSRVWEMIIPNSQLVINPYPLDKPSQWKMTLFVMPSQEVWYTAIALAVTCVVGAIIVIAFHLYEKHEDSKEKKQESQKFHFDAM